MRLRKLIKPLAIITLILVCLSGLFATLPASALRSAKAQPFQAKSDNFVEGGWNEFLPLIEKNFLPTLTLTPTSTPMPSGCILTHYGAFEQQLLVLINNEREKVGLADLTANYPLEISSGIHSDDMAANNFMSHTGSDGSSFWLRAQRAGYTGSYGGEIIMMGVSTPEQAVAWWMGDQPHRDMILSATNDFGAGYAHCYNHYYTVDFGHR
jgi:uncharacterized protein YkwD